METKIFKTIVALVVALFPRLRWRFTETSIRRFLNLPPDGYTFVDGVLCRVVTRSEAAFDRQNKAARKRSIRAAGDRIMDLQKDVRWPMYPSRPRDRKKES